MTNITFQHKSSAFLHRSVCLALFGKPDPHSPAPINLLPGLLIYPLHQEGRYSAHNPFVLNTSMASVSLGLPFQYPILVTGHQANKQTNQERSLPASNPIRDNSFI